MSDDIKILNYDMPTNRVYIVPIGDMHIGLKEFEVDKFLKYRSWILSNENAYVTLMGDIFETPISRVRTQDEPITPSGMTVPETVDFAYDLFMPMRDRLIGVVEGNHELRSSMMTGGDALGTLMERMGLTHIYDHDTLLIQIKVGDVVYRQMVQHGWGGARRTGGQVNKMEEMSNVVGDADIYCTGHEHTLFMSRWDKDVARSGTVVELRQVYVGCGCFCKLTRFQKRIARRKPNIGSPRIRLNGSKRDVHVSI